MFKQLLSFSALGLLCLTACDGPSPALHGHLTPEVNKIIVKGGADRDGDGDKDHDGGRDRDGDGAKDSPLKLVGERLFRETRFSQYFFSNHQSSFNQFPAVGDPVVSDLITISQKIAHPYQGQSISCAACHFVEQASGIKGGGSRAYTDFARRSPIPDRGDGSRTTVRNSPNMVAMSLTDGLLLHHDGEFGTPEDLCRASYTGRNMGWLVGEEDTAIHHIAQVIRQDDGSFPTETDLAGLSYKDLLAGSPKIPRRFLVPAEFRMDISKASDQEIFSGMVKLVGGYLRTLNYARGPQGQFVGSPYDVFLQKNGLPQAPNANESPSDYSERLGLLLQNLKDPKFVGPSENSFKLHKQEFKFTEKELAGAKVFFSNGQCLHCHTAPDFTDHRMHNTGASQLDYENIHGEGSFRKLHIPNLAERNKTPEIYLPASKQHPKSQAIFRSAPSKEDPKLADLGAWATYANPDMPKPQQLLRQAICEGQGYDCIGMTEDEVLKMAIGAVKTPSVRDLGQSEPYLHTGQMDNIEDVIRFYMKTSEMVRAGDLVNPDPWLSGVKLLASDVEPLAAFLRSLNEDYQ